jgi:hypothetical protein
MNYTERLKISVDGDEITDFYSKSKVFIARGYKRIVIGERGPYIEFERKNFSSESNLIIPLTESWRTKSKNVYYVEWSACPNLDNIKVYFQKRVVDYADYKIGKFYISPFDLYVNKKPVISKKVKGT